MSRTQAVVSRRACSGNNSRTVGMRIEIYVILTDKCAAGVVVYVDPDQPRHCGMGLNLIPIYTSSRLSRREF